MSVVNLIDTVTEWARNNICSKILLKSPHEIGEASDEAYDYELVNPAAFSLFVPASDKLPPGVTSPIPSLCVRVVSGADNMAAGKGSAEVQFCFSTWSTGLHGKDILLPVEGQPGTFRRMSDEEAKTVFVRSGDGWRDAWNFLDIALREIESTVKIGNYAIDKSVPVKFGPLTEQEAIPDYYPHWFTWASFTLTYDIKRNVEELQRFL